MGKTKSMKKGISVLLALVMVFGLVQLPISTKAAESDSEKATVSLYPTPQSITIDSEEGMKLNGTVDVVIHGTHEEATLLKLEALAKEENIVFEITEEVGTNAALVLAVDCGDDTCAICNSVADSAGALEHEQGYVLKTSNDSNTNGLITIVGADTDGAYYGVISLYQLFRQKTSDGRIAEVTVSDYPDVLFRGYVEGFYGEPWSFEDRADLFETTTMYKMTTYIYAPKDDPYHRDSWRTLYPEKEAKELTELAEIAAANNMEFCWSIHPGADYDYTTDSDGDGLADDYERLLEKIEQVYSFGVRQFGIFYDDLGYDLAVAENHSGVINSAYEYLKEKYGDVKPFITVLTRYTNGWGAPMNSYFTPFMNQINEDTIVLWTGNDTMSAITKNYYEWPKTQTGVDRDFGVWWNYPVTDYCFGHLFMGSLDCLDTDVDNICSFFLNPMSESDASKVALYSGADYSWNITDFNSKESWSRAILELVPEANEAFERFADNISYASKGSGFEFDESVYMKDDIDAFKNAAASGEGLAEAISNLKARFEQIQADAEVLEGIQNEALYEEVKHHIEAYGYMGEAGVAAMEGYEAALAGDVEGTMSSIAELEAALQACRNCKNEINGPVRAVVGSHKIMPLLEEITPGMMDVLAANLSSTTASKMITNIDGLAVWEVVYEGKAYNVKEITAVMNNGDYVGIVLAEADNLYEISADTAQADSFKLQYSLNGIEWKDIATDVSGSKLKSTEIVTAAYARLLCIKDGTNAAIEKFKVSPAYESVAVAAKASTDLPVYQNYTINKALDGKLDTWFWSSSGTSDGNYLAVDLGGAAELGQIDLYSAINKYGDVDAFASTQLEVSDDGNTWKKVGEAKPVSEFAAVEGDETLSKLSFDATGEVARYFRFTAAGTSDSWLMVHEIVYDAQYLEFESRIAVDTNMDIYEDYVGVNAMDGNKSTYMWIYNQLDGTGQFGSYKDDYVQVDLGTIVSLYDAGIYFGKAENSSEVDVEGFASVKLQTSVDGKTWKNVGETVTLNDYTETDGLYLASVSSDGSLARYMRFVADEDCKNWAKVHEVVYNQAINNLNITDVSTNMGTYQNYSIANAADSNMESKYYSDNVTNVGDYIQIELDVEAPIYDASVYFGGDPHRAAIDGFRGMKLQVSKDGEVWRDAGEAVLDSKYSVVGGKYHAELNGNGARGKYIRFTATEAGDSWVQVYEIKLNETIDTNAVKYTEGTVTIGQSNYLDDGKLETAPNIYNVKDGDTLIYPMTTVTNVKTIGVYQEAGTGSTAGVSVQYADGTWAEVGELDSTWNQFEINDTLLAVKFTFDGTVTNPTIYEIIVTEKAAGANYSAVDAALAKVPADLSIYTKETADAVSAAINNVVRGLEAEKQAEVDAMAKAINDAVKALELKAADYSEIENLKKTVPTDLKGYTTASLEALNEALSQIKYDLDITEQEQVDNWAKDLKAAIEGLDKIPAEQPEDPDDSDNPDKPDKDEPNKDESNKDESNKDDTDKGESPATGDSAVTMIYIMMMAVCTVIVMMKRKRA